MPSAGVQAQMPQITDSIPIYHHEGVPKLLQMLVQTFISLEGYKEKGIFRLASDADEKNRMRAALGMVCDQ